MKLTLEYGEQKFTANLTDSEEHLWLALSLAWELSGSKEKILRMPRPIMRPTDENTLEKLKKAWKIKGN